ncbi:MAG: ABC transporter ATP-binding protein [Alphaproteobacteria bacterium]
MAARLALSGIVKRYPGVLANDDIALNIAPGEVHALLGENGAGKSTLVKIIYGVVAPDAGDILWEGKSVTISSPLVARGLGIGMVFQHFNLFETLTVAQNISLGLEPGHDLDHLSEEIVAISNRYGLPIHPKQLVHGLSVGERQRVEIIRCLVQNPKLLIMDEPTSVLTPQEIDGLFKVLTRLADEGCSILYISHKLGEIRTLCHAATVLRQGRVTATCDPKKETPKSLAEMMIGSELPVTSRSKTAEFSGETLRVADLSLASPDPLAADLRGINFTVRSGEVFGIAGVAGNGQKELLAALNGELRSPDAAMITIEGVACAHLAPARRRKLGLAFVPEERLGRGAVPEMSLAQNTLLAGAGKSVARGLIDFDQSATTAQAICTRFKVVAAGVQAQARSLSGGNLQKFIIGREIGLEPKLLILGHPTWGVDVGAATIIHQAIIDLAMQGAAIVVVSEDLDELFEICDTIAVMAEGRLSPARPAGATSVEEVGLWMAGQFPEDGELRDAH